MFFSNIVNIRLTDDQRVKIENEVRENPEIYNSVSHYIRVAILQKLRGN